ncbi:hypothetical protein Trydic_g16762 [Trypoxylus dichotomus]
MLSATKISNRSRNIQNRKTDSFIYEIHVGEVAGKVGAKIQTVEDPEVVKLPALILTACKINCLNTHKKQKQKVPSGKKKLEELRAKTRKLLVQEKQSNMHKNICSSSQANNDIIAKANFVIARVEHDHLMLYAPSLLHRWFGPVQLRGGKYIPGHM